MIQNYCVISSAPPYVEPPRKPLHSAIIKAKQIQSSCPNCAKAQNIGHICKKHSIAMSKALAKADNIDWNNEQSVRFRMLQVHFQLILHFSNYCSITSSSIPKSYDEVLESIRAQNKYWFETTYGIKNT